MYFNTRSDTGSEITRLSQFLLDESNPDVVDYNSEIRILDLEQPFTNHNGAMVYQFSYEKILHTPLSFILLLLLLLLFS